MTPDPKRGKGFAGRDQSGDANICGRPRVEAVLARRQYQRPISNFTAPFGLPAAGELIVWSRILDDEEVVCVVNGHGQQRRGGDVLVDAKLNGSGTSFQVVANSAQAADASFDGTHALDSKLPVKFRDGAAFVEIRDVRPSEVILLSNHP